MVHTNTQIGNYRLISQLGSGGFANVYLGEHIHLGTKAAIKILTTTLTYDQFEQFRTEARTIASLSHPNIIRVLDFGIQNNIPFLIMQYAPLGSLRQRHPRGQVLPLDTLLLYIKQMAAALQYAHDQKLVHCDVKPENMLLGPHQEVLLSDFGIAIVAQTNKQAKHEQISGTVAYMAPEQLQGHPEFASDQYSLGIIAYEWLCGTPPFTGRYIEVAIQHERSLPPPLHDKIPISPAVEAVIMTALEKDPKQRFASVTAFANALERAIQLTSSLSASTSRSTQFALSLQAGLLSQSTYSSYQAAFHAPTSENMPQEVRQPRPSRRTVIMGLGLTGGAAVVGGAAYLAQTLGSHAAANHQQPPLSFPPQQVVTFSRHGHHVQSVAWSPDSKRIVSGAFNGTVYVWDATSGKLILPYTGHTQTVWMVAWSPDGKYIASGSGDTTVHVWDATTGQLILPPYTDHTDAVFAVAWSPDGKYVASGSGDTTVRVWDITSGTTTYTYKNHPAGVHRISWSHDGARIVSGNQIDPTRKANQSVHIWTLTDPTEAYVCIRNSQYGGAWAPDSRRIASTNATSNTVVVWQAV